MVENALFSKQNSKTQLTFEENVAVKSLSREMAKRLPYEMEDIFKNEIINYQIIKKSTETLKSYQEKLKLTTLEFDSEELMQNRFFVEYIGFMLNDENDPYFGSIVMKYYPLGDLATYTAEISCPEHFSNIENIKKEKLEAMPGEIIQLVDFAKQIALGKKIKKVFKNKWSPL